MDGLKNRIYTIKEREDKCELSITGISQLWPLPFSVQPMDTAPMG